MPDGGDVPDDLQFTPEHEWVRTLANGRLKVGITAYAQEALGDVVFVTLPQVGEAVTAGGVFGEVESTKSVSDLYAPASGTVAERNGALEQQPELVNSDPYGDGWMIEIDAVEAVGELLSAAAYRELIELQV